MPVNAFVVGCWWKVAVVDGRLHRAATWRMMQQSSYPGGDNSFRQVLGFLSQRGAKMTTKDVTVMTVVVRNATTKCAGTACSCSGNRVAAPAAARVRARVAVQALEPAAGVDVECELRRARAERGVVGVERLEGAKLRGEAFLVGRRPFHNSHSIAVRRRGQSGRGRRRAVRAALPNRELFSLDEHVIM